MHICPICGYPNLEEKPYNENDDSSFEICPSCGTEFGYQDAASTKKERKRKWEKIRKKWIKDGAKWAFPKDKPKNWKLEDQLKNLKN